MSKKIAPVSRKRVISAWVGVALLSFFSIVFALFLEHSTVFGSEQENPYPPTLLRTRPVERSLTDTVKTSECADVIRDAQNNIKNYDKKTQEALQVFHNSPFLLERQLRLIKNTTSDQDLSETRNLIGLISELQRKCAQDETGLADKSKCDKAKEIAAGQDDLLRPLLEHTIVAAENGEDYIAGTGNSSEESLYNTFQFENKDEFLQNIVGCVPNNLPCAQALIQMSANLYPQANDDIKTLRRKNKEEIEEVARDFSENINTLGADKELYKELSGLVQKCADTLADTVDPCQQAITKIKNSSSYGSKDYAINILQGERTEDVRRLSAEFNEAIANLRNTTNNEERIQFYSDTKELLDKCVEYRTSTNGRESKAIGGDSCQQATEYVTDNSDFFRSRLGFGVEGVVDKNKEELRALSAELERQISSPQFSEAERNKIETMSNLLASCASSLEANAPAPVDREVFAERLENDEDFKNLFKWSLIAELLNSLLNNDWERAILPLATLLSGNEGLANLGSSFLTGNTNPLGAITDAIYNNNPLLPNSFFYPGLQMGGFPQQEAQKMFGKMFKVNTYKNILGSLGNIVSRFMPEEKEVIDKEEVVDEECLEAFRAKQRAQEQAIKEETETEDRDINTEEIEETALLMEEGTTPPDSTPATSGQSTTTKTTTITVTTTATPPGKYDHITSEEQCKKIVETPRTTTPRADFIEEFNGWLEDLSGLAQALVARQYLHLADSGFYSDSFLNQLMGGYGSNLPGYNFSSNTFGFPSPNAGQYSYGASNPYGFGFGGYGSGYDGYGTIGNPYTNILGQHQYGQNPYSGQPYGNMSITPVQQGNFRILLTQFIRGASTQLTEVTGQILLAPSGIFMKNLNNNEIYRFTGINENDQNKGLTIWEKIIPMLNRGWYNPFLPPWGMSIY